MKKEKDFWDKLSSMSTFLSTVLIAIVGSVFTYIFNAREAEHQHNIQETQTVAQLMPFLTSKEEKQQRTALIAIKVLQDTTLMTNLAAADPSSPGARQALRDVAFSAANEKDRLIAADALRQLEFVAPCSLPPELSAITHPIDDSFENSCGMFGKFDSEAQKNENFSMNNFCAGARSGIPADKGEPIDFNKLNSLQRQVESDPTINWGNENNTGRDPGPTSNRSSLARLGEGKFVSLKGYVLIARQEGPERVNCRDIVPNQPDYHNIHIALVPTPQDDECKSVVVELSPHHRPLQWTASNVNQVAHSNLLVRVSGQLFFNSTHQPCKNGNPVVGNAKRATLWEVHPIYKFEVCTSSCDQQGVWVTLSDWIKKTNDTENTD